MSFSVVYMRTCDCMGVVGGYVCMRRCVWGEGGGVRACARVLLVLC